MMSVLTSVAPLGAPAAVGEIMADGPVVLVPFGDYVETASTDADLTTTGDKDNESSLSLAASDAPALAVVLPVMEAPAVEESRARAPADADTDISVRLAQTGGANQTPPHEPEFVAGKIEASLPATPVQIQAVPSDGRQADASGRKTSDRSDQRKDGPEKDARPDFTGPSPRQAGRDDPSYKRQTDGPKAQPLERGRDPEKATKHDETDRNQMLAMTPGVPPQTSAGGMPSVASQPVTGLATMSPDPSPTKSTAPEGGGATSQRPPDLVKEPLPGHKRKGTEAPRQAEEVSEKKHAHPAVEPQRDVASLTPASSVDTFAKLLPGDGQAAAAPLPDQQQPPSDFPVARGEEPVTTVLAGRAPMHMPIDPKAAAHDLPFLVVDRSAEVGRQLAASLTDLSGRSVEVTLAPEELGRVTMTVATGDSGLTLTLVAERSETLELMRRNIDQLAQEFRDLGFGTLNFAFSHDGKAQHGAPEPEGADEGDKAAPTRLPTLPPADSRAPATQCDVLDLRL